MKFVPSDKNESLNNFNTVNPPEFDLKKENKSNMLVLFSDLKIANGNFRTVYTKHDAFPFSILCTPNIDWNISPKLFTHSKVQKGVKITTDEKIIIKLVTNLVLR